MSVICDITHTLEANPAPVYCIHKCDVENLKPPKDFFILAFHHGGKFCTFYFTTI